MCKLTTTAVAFVLPSVSVFWISLYSGLIQKIICWSRSFALPCTTRGGRKWRHVTVTSLRHVAGRRS